MNNSAKELKKLSEDKKYSYCGRKNVQLKTCIILIAFVHQEKKGGAAKHLKKNTGKQNLAEIQKTVLTSTSNVLRKVLSI